MTGENNPADMEHKTAPPPPFPVLTGPVTDPTHNIISSERYLEGLERKLDRLKGKTSGQVTSRQIIKSLEKAKEDHMQNFMADPSITARPEEDPDQYKGSVVNKTHTSVNHCLEEVVALVYQDELSKVNSEHLADDTQTSNKT